MFWTRFGSMRAAVAGHFWTLAPLLASAIRPAVPPPARHFRTVVDDDVVGPLRLTGRLSEPAGASEIVVVVHGLGGSADAPYALLAARAAAAAGLASLRLNMRGADRRGEDYYHAGLTSDLHAVLRAVDLARYDAVYVLGYSLGGHVALRFATEPHDPRVRAVAAVCPPLDLALSAYEIDRPLRTPYRRFVLSGLKEMYAGVARRRSAAALIPVGEAMRIDTIRAWDDRIVAPRHGFRDAEDYWERASVAPRLGEIRLPALVVHAAGDPMVLAHTVRPCVERCSTVTHAWIDRGGHVGFPSDLSLGFGTTLGLEAQVVSFLRSRDRVRT